MSRGRKFGKVDNLVTSSSNYGKQQRYSNYFTASLNTRFGGASSWAAAWTSGARYGQLLVSITRNNCQDCQPGHPVPRHLAAQAEWELPVAARLRGERHLPERGGTCHTADYTALNSEIAPSLGRSLSACPTTTGACTASTAAGTVPLIRPYTQFEGRRTELDLRLTKFIKLGSRMRLQANLDIYNVVNNLPILAIVTAWGPNWRKPNNIVSILGTQDPRQIQFSGQLTF